MPGRLRSHYRELPPPAALAPYVECLWVQDVGGAGPYDQPVLPDGAIDLVARDEGVIVAGPSTRAVTVRYPRAGLTVGARFRPGAAPPLLGVAADELRDRAVPLDALWGPAGATVTERVLDAAGRDLDDLGDLGARGDLGDAGTVASPAARGGPGPRLAVLVEGLAARLDGAPAIDPAVRASVLALRSTPATPVTALAAGTGLSERQLRRRVDVAVGYSPRMLARVVRFQRFLRAARATPAAARDLARLAGEAGYADQAHLTREARRLAGLPPAALLDQEAARLAGA
jgi:AraC-like DNA-binding protein